MAYNSNKGPQNFGDIHYDGDPAETQIDFEDDLIALKTNNLQRLIVSSSAITASVIFSASAGVYADAFYGDGTNLTNTGVVTSYTNTTDNYVLTSTGAGSINGEANLTFNGSALVAAGTLAVTVANNPVAQLVHPSDNAVGAVLELINSKAGNAGDADDFCGGVVFKSKDSTSAATQYSMISTKIGSPTNTSESGYMLFEVTTAGTSATTYLRLDGPTSAITASMNTLINANLSVSGNVGIGTTNPGYDLHVNGTGVTEATIDGGTASDAYLRFATNGVAKSYVKLGSGGNLIVAQDATGGSLLLAAKPGGVSTTYLTLDGGTTAITASTDIHFLGATHQSGSAYKKYSTKTSNYTLTNTDNIIYMNTNSATLTASLPDARTVGGIVYTLKNIGSNDMVIDPNGAQTVDGLNSLTGSLGKAWTVQATDDIWFILSSHQG